VKVVKIGILPEKSTPTLLPGDQSLDDPPERHHDDERGDDEYLIEQRSQLPPLGETIVVQERVTGTVRLP
jgi:hypothetical protein